MTQMSARLQKISFNPLKCMSDENMAATATALTTKATTEAVSAAELASAVRN